MLTNLTKLLTVESFSNRVRSGLRNTTTCLSNSDSDVQLSYADSWAFFCQKMSEGGMGYVIQQTESKCSYLDDYEGGPCTHLRHLCDLCGRM